MYIFLLKLKVSVKTSRVSIAAICQSAIFAFFVRTNTYLLLLFLNLDLKINWIHLCMLIYISVYYCFILKLLLFFFFYYLFVLYSQYAATLQYAPVIIYSIISRSFKCFPFFVVVMSVGCLLSKEQAKQKICFLF